MWIRHFTKNIELNELKVHELKNCEVVIDGQNFLYNIYEWSGLPFEFGCESDKYADILREKLRVFKNANVKCYFIFKGGRSDSNERGRKREKSYSNFVLPIFMKEIYKQVLDEMNFNYVICEFESKKQCVALAQKLNCPLISFDTEYCFSGVSYIHNYDQKKFFINAENKESIPCGLFVYEDFIKKYNLNKEKLATFIVLTDVSIFPEDHFKSFFDIVNIRGNPFQRNKFLLNWLSKKANYDTIETILQRILKSNEIDSYRKEKSKIIESICKEEKAGVPIDYLMHDNHLEFTDNDPLWFEKGVACDFIPLQYVNVYHWNIIDGSWCLEDEDAEDTMFIVLDIIKYAYNLLTNYERKEILFRNKNYEEIFISVSDATSVPKPTYSAIQSPFENGWDKIKTLGLFEHFLGKCMPETNFNVLNTVPEDVRLLIIALVYFSRHKAEDTIVEVCSVLLSYVMLGVVNLKSNNNNDIDKIVPSTSYFEPFTDTNLVTNIDCNIAKDKLAKYSTVSDIDKELIDKKILHPLVEFQHCLQHLNFLNKLCGSPFKSTIYSRTYNGTLVYEIATTIQDFHFGEVMDFINNELSSAATVSGFFNGLKNVYEEIMYR